MTKKKPVTITLMHMFNGEATGAETRHRVTSPDGLLRLIEKHGTNGWGVRVFMNSKAAKSLGAYKTQYDDWIVPCASLPAGGFPIDPPSSN